MLINYSHFLHFEDEWDKILESHGIATPLHMKEFGKNGRLGKISQCCRRELFLELSQLINSHKVGSLSATLTNADYEKYIPKEARDIYSAYAMCFDLALMMNHKLAEAAHYEKKIPFILDTGNPYANHVRVAHKAALEMQKTEGFLHVGGLYFDDDAEFGSLQAADVIAWTIRRLASGFRLPPGMEPLTSIISYQADHRDHVWETEWMKHTGGNILRRIEENKRKMEAEQNSEDDEEY